MLRSIARDMWRVSPHGSNTHLVRALLLLFGHGRAAAGTKSTLVSASQHPTTEVIPQSMVVACACATPCCTRATIDTREGGGSPVGVRRCADARRSPDRCYVYTKTILMPWFAHPPHTQRVLQRAPSVGSVCGVGHTRWQRLRLPRHHRITHVTPPRATPRAPPPHLRSLDVLLNPERICRSARAAQAAAARASQWDDAGRGAPTSLT